MSLITRETARRVLEVVDQGLISGLGKPKPGSMCVEAAVCFALGLPHSDDPKCVSQAIRSLKINLNDGPWSNDKARTQGLRKLSILQLGTNINFDDRLFAEKSAMFVINNLLPRIFWKCWPKEALACKEAIGLVEGKDAANAAYAAANADAGAAAAYAANAAANAAYAAAYSLAAAAYAAANANAANANAAANAAAAAAAYAAYAAAYAANAAGYAAAYAANARDSILREFATGIENILIEMKVPGVQWLDLLEKGDVQ